MSQETQKERLIRIMGTFDLATGHADTFDELLDSLETELRDVLGHYRAAVKEHLTQEPVAMLERDPSIGRLRVTYEDAVTELDEGVYPLYVKPQIEIGCSECGIGDGHALYCVRCAEKFVGGYKENVPVHTSELLTQVSTDTQYAGNGTAGIQNETKPTGFFFQMPPQRTWVGLTEQEQGAIMEDLNAHGTNLYHFAKAIEAKLKEKNT